jgi:hypothetical protein
MRTGLLAIILPLALSTGCASMYKQRVNQQLWERELRLQEDCIYRLKWQLEDAQRQLDDANTRLGSSTKENNILRDSVGPDLTAPIPSTSSGRPDAPRLPPAPNQQGLPNIQQGQEFIPGSTPPTTTPPKPGGTSIRSPELRGPSVKPASLTTPVDSKDLSGNPLRPSERMNADAEVERIVLNTAHTGGLNSDGKAGDDMLSVAIEQRDTKDQRILAPGDLSIVLVDPALDGSEAKLGRWNFDSDEVARHVRRNRDGASYQFELPFQTHPAHSDLRLFVRFTTFDGRRLETNLPIEVDLGSERSPSGSWKLAPISRPSKETAAASQTASSENKWNEKASVYEPADDPRQASAEDDTPRAANRDRPSWSPSR